MADWANLPEGLLDLIAERIHQIKDLIVIHSVCKPWQSTLTFDPPKFPLLMLADGNQELPSMVKKEDVIRRSRCFFNLFTSKIYEIDLPEAYARKCLGIGFGWMLTFGMDFNINLLHPFLRQQICLSPESTFTHQYDKDDFANPLHALLKQAVLSCSPCQESCIIMVIYGRDSYLAFARVRSNDKPWIDVQSPLRGFDGLIYYKEQFYAVDFRGRVVVCNINDDNDPRATSIAPPPIGLMDPDKKCLVESSGDLLLISRIYGGKLFDYDDDDDDDENDNDDDNDNDNDDDDDDDDDGSDDYKDDGGDDEDDDDNDDDDGDDDDDGGDDYKDDGGDEDGRVSYYTKKFLIFKMEEVEDGAHEFRYKWVKVKDLGNRALFLGNNSSFSFDTSSSSLLKPNCIYFTDDNEFLRHRGKQYGNDMGIFNMDTGTIEHYYTGKSYSKYSPPLWYI